MLGVIAMLSHPTMPTAHGRRARSLREIVVQGGLLLIASLAVTLGSFSAPALAKVVKIEENSEERHYGVTPRSLELPSSNLELRPNEFENFEGHAVVHSSNVYAVYWDPTKYRYHGDWLHLIDGFFHNMGAESGSLSNVFAVDTQYVDRANLRNGYGITFRGAYADTDAYPTTGNCTDPAPLHGADAITCVTDAQIKEELKSFIAAHQLQTGMNAIFYVLTPPGVTVCLDGGGATGHCSDYKHTGEPKVVEENFKRSLCSYHADINPTGATEGDSSTILYAVVPWIAGGLGDYHLLPSDQTPAFDCQDGGYDPSSKPIEKLEKAKEKTQVEIEAIKKMNAEELEKQAQKELLEGPHQEEPNQVVGVGPDGSPDTGLADLIINQVAVEQQNTTTNPLLNAWRDSKGNELMDECRNWFAAVRSGSVGANEGTDAGTLANQTIGAGNYYLNDTFNLAALMLDYPGVPCINGLNLVPQFTVPNRVNTNELVGFDGMESDITLDAGVAFSSSGESHPTYSTFTWNFGDGSPLVSGYAPGAPSVNSPGVSPCPAPWEAPCAASAYHSYQYGGTYEVTLTVTDLGGDTTSVTEPVTVSGAPPPPPPPPPAPGGGSSTSTGAAPSPAVSVAPVVPPTPPPVLGASVMSKSLKKVLSGGLAVRYTANEQVAGSIQVLLESTAAKRLGIKGANATGLPAGTPSSIVVGTAVLVTTKAGQGTIRIKFTTRAAARLKRVHKLKLTLRLFARNASRQSPQTTTVLSTVTLSR